MRARPFRSGDPPFHFRRVLPYHEKAWKGGLQLKMSDLPGSMLSTVCSWLNAHRTKQPTMTLLLLLLLTGLLCFALFFKATDGAETI